MKNYLLFGILAITISFVSCKKKDDPAEKEREEREAYLSEHNITTAPTESGLYYIETLSGTGRQAVAGNTVKVHYEGRLLDGTIFDSSYDRVKPFEFILGDRKVIQGWDEGIAYMKEGGKATLIIPSELGYGARGTGSIPGYSTLTFDVELIDVQ